MGVSPEDSLVTSTQSIMLFLALAASPLEDTPEVAAAKAEFQAAFEAAAAGEHANLAPVNNDVQAEQIPNAYLDDDVAAAKAAFQAAFDDVVAGGLAAKQAPAPVPEAAPISTITPFIHSPLNYPLGYPLGLQYGGYPYSGYPYNVLPQPYHTTIPHNYLYSRQPYLV